MVSKGCRTRICPRPDQPQPHVRQRPRRASGYVTAASWYHKAAEQGQAIAQNNLGAMYFKPVHRYADTMNITSRQGAGIHPRTRTSGRLLNHRQQYYASKSVYVESEKLPIFVARAGGEGVSHEIQHQTGSLFAPFGS